MGFIKIYLFFCLSILADFEEPDNCLQLICFDAFLRANRFVIIFGASPRPGGCIKPI